MVSAMSDPYEISASELSDRKVSNHSRPILKCYSKTCPKRSERTQLSSEFQDQ
jgi:hypothetical protein